MSAAGVTEVDLMAQWLWDRLSGYSGWAALGLGNPARIAEGMAPASMGAAAGSPVLVYQLQDPIADDLIAATGGIRIWTQALWTVKAVVQGESYTPLRGIVNQADVLLQAQSGGATSGGVSGTILYAQRVGQLRYPEVDEHGVPWRHLGAVYRVYAQ